MTTELDFYKKALRLQSLVLKRLAQVKAYEEDWSPKFCKQEVVRYFEDYVELEEVKELFKIENLTKERALNLGFSYWDSTEYPNLLLFPLWYVFLLPYGTKVINIFGQEEVFTKETDLDNRFGCVAFGVQIEN